MKKQSSLLFALAIIVLIGGSWYGARTLNFGADNELSPASSAPMRLSGAAANSDYTSVSGPSAHSSAAVSDASGVADTMKVAEIVEASEKLIDGFNAAAAVYGWDDRYLAELAYEATIACGKDMDPTGSLSRQGVDKTRAWAVVRLAHLCDGFPEGGLKLASKSMAALPSTLLGDGNKDAAVSAAARVIEGASNATFQELFDAGAVLIDTNMLPSHIRQETSSLLGQPELYKAWAVAATLIRCETHGGCGSRGLLVARYCALKGCSQGVDYAGAVRESLTAKEYRAVMAFYKWMRGY